MNNNWRSTSSIKCITCWASKKLKHIKQTGKWRRIRRRRRERKKKKRGRRNHLYSFGWSNLIQLHSSDSIFLWASFPLSLSPPFFCPPLSSRKKFFQKNNIKETHITINCSGFSYKSIKYNFTTNPKKLKRCFLLLQFFCQLYHSRHWYCCWHHRRRSHYSHLYTYFLAAIMDDSFNIWHIHK